MVADTEGPLVRLLPPEDDVTPDSLLDGFLTHVTDLGLELYPAQEEAILEIFQNKNVILNTPTGSGKSLVANAIHFKALAEGQRSFYTAPIKALVSEKFFDLCRTFSPDDVGMMTGDATVNRDAPIICCTAEILANLALREGAEADVDYVVMDEFHYYADRDRGVAWQVPLLTLSQATFLLMSATLGETVFFEEALSSLTKKETVLVRTAERPVPLHHEYRETPIHETVADLLAEDRAPVYMVHFSQRAACDQAQNLMSVDFLSRDQKLEIRRAMTGVRFDTPYGKDLKRYLQHGVGVHHAGLLPKYRRVVERLAQKGHLRVICGTDTLGVGVNIPIRTVLFTRLCKFDGENTRVLSVRDFKQVSGRAGRRGFDEQGFVVAQAPEHVIENRVLEAKAAGDPKKRRKLAFKKPPDRGYAHWDKNTFERLISSEPERLSSSFHVSHGMMLNVLGRPEHGCQAMKDLIRRCHEGPRKKHHVARQAIALFRSLVEAEIVELVTKTEGVGKRAQVNEDLQQDFSLNQALSLYAVDAIALLDHGDPGYALDVISIVESILENPTGILLRQLDKLKRETLASLKAEGVEYEERMEELDKLDYPKPIAEFIYGSFNGFAERHPWVGAENIRPKSIVREMYEGGLTFVDYVREYGLERSEGLLLRYLSDAYATLLRNVPEGEKTAEVLAAEEWLGTIVRHVDASLLEEWERMRDPDALLEEARRGPTEEDRDKAVAEEDITSDRHAFTVLVQNHVWRLLTMLARRRYQEAAKLVTEGAPGEPWDAERIGETMQPYWAEYPEIRTDPVARNPRNMMVDEQDGDWHVRQVIVDPEENKEWHVELRVRLDRAREEGHPVLELIQIGTT